jgi:hypothetical protein
VAEWLSSSGKAALVRDSGNIARAMQDTDNDHGIRQRAVVDGVRAVERDAQAGGKLLSQGRGQGEIPHRLKGGFDRRDKAGGVFLRRPACNITPDFGKVGFGCLREAKG